MNDKVTTPDRGFKLQPLYCLEDGCFEEPIDSTLYCAKHQPKIYGDMTPGEIGANEARQDVTAEVTEVTAVQLTIEQMYTILEKQSARIVQLEGDLAVAHNLTLKAAETITELQSANVILTADNRQLRGMGKQLLQLLDEGVLSPNPNQFPVGSFSYNLDIMRLEAAKVFDYGMEIKDTFVREAFPSHNHSEVKS